MKRSRIFLLTALLPALGLLAGCAPEAVLGDAMEPFVPSLAWGMTAAEVCDALDIDLEVSLQTGVAQVRSDAVFFQAELPGLLGENVPARLQIAGYPEMLCSIVYEYPADRLPALQEALEKQYGEAVIITYRDDDGTLYDTSQNPRSYPASAQPYVARWSSRETMKDHPDALTFLTDASRTGYPDPAFGPPLGLEPEDPLCRVELTLSDPDGTGTVTLTQDGARACTYRVFQDYQEVRDRYPLLADYITALRERWLETYPQADPST